MIYYITGVPGSGKTIKGLNEILKSIEDKESCHDVVYTNIDQFDFSISDKILPYDHDQIFRRITLLHKYYKKKYPGNKLIRLSRLLKLHKALFVIDECHNYFDTRNTVLVWWLSYHRHLFQDIYLITQNLSLIDSKYKKFTEFYYRAQPQSLKLFSKNFKYKLFVDSRMSKTSYAGSETIKYDPKLFELYRSGDKPKTKNVIHYFVLLSSIILILVVSAFWYYLNSLKSRADSSRPQTHQNVSLPQSRNHDNSARKSGAALNSSFDDSQLLSFHCIDYLCRYESATFSLRTLTEMIKRSNSVILDLRHDSRTNVTEVDLLASYSFQNFLKGYTNEETLDIPSPADILNGR